MITSTSIKVAPCGEEAYANQAQGIFPQNDMFLFVGSLASQRAWERVRCHPVTTLYLPPKSSPGTFYWPVMGCDVLVFETSPLREAQLAYLAKILFEFDAEVVRVVTHDWGFIKFIREV